MARLAALLVPAAIAACAAGSETGLAGVTAEIFADAGEGVSKDPADDGGVGSSSGSASAGSSSSGSGGSTGGGKGDASGPDAASNDASDANNSAPDSSAPLATDADASGGDGASDGATTSCPISVTKDSYDTTYDGYINYVNTGTGSETNPTVKFTLPSTATLDNSGCTGSTGLDNQTVPSSITALSCSQSGTTIVYAFTGIVPPNAQMALYYTTNLASEAAATEVTVTAESCP
jgi:hypothetical protein